MSLLPNLTQFVRSTLRSSFRAALGHVPYALLSSVALALSTGMVFWVWLVPQDAIPPSQRAAIELLFLAVYLLIGLCCAVERVIDCAVTTTLSALKTGGPALFDPLLDLVLGVEPTASRVIRLDEARERWIEGASQLRYEPEKARWSIAGRVGNWVVRTCVQRKATVVREVFHAVHLRGDKHVDAVSLGCFIRDRLIDQIVRAGQQKLSVVRAWFYAAVVLAALLPLALCWLVHAGRL